MQYVQYGALVCWEAARTNTTFDDALARLTMAGPSLEFPVSLDTEQHSWNNMKRLFLATLSAFLDHNVPDPSLGFSRVPVGPPGLASAGQEQVDDFLLQRNRPIFQVAQRAYEARGAASEHPDYWDGQLAEPGYDQHGLCFHHGDLPADQNNPALARVEFAGRGPHSHSRSAVSQHPQPAIAKRPRSKNRPGADRRHRQGGQKKRPDAPQQSGQAAPVTSDGPNASLLRLEAKFSQQISGLRDDLTKLVKDARPPS